MIPISFVRVVFGGSKIISVKEESLEDSSFINREKKNITNVLY